MIPANYSTISFPSLGIEVNPGRTLALGPLTIHYYGLIIAIGLMLAVVYACRRCSQFGIKQDDLLDGVLWVTPFAILCARAYYCIFSWADYAENPISVLYIWNGGLAIYGGVLGAVAGILLLCRIKKIKIGALLDMVALGFLIGQSIGRWGNFVNREAFGAATDSFFRMGLYNTVTGAWEYYHPTFLYESVWNAVGFVLLHVLSKHRKYDGEIALGYVAWYGLGRCLIEGLRMDSLYWGSVRVSQLLAGICFLAVVIFLVYDKIFREHDPKDLYVNQVAQRKAAEAAAAAEENVSEVEETAEDTETVEAEEAAGTEAEAAPEDASDEDTEA